MIFAYAAASASSHVDRVSNALFAMICENVVNVIAFQFSRKHAQHIAKSKRRTICTRRLAGAIKPNQQHVE